jgi:hypothetical protein
VEVLIEASPDRINSPPLPFLTLPPGYKSSTMLIKPNGRFAIEIDKKGRVDF